MRVSSCVSAVDGAVVAAARRHRCRGLRSRIKERGAEKMYKKYIKERSERNGRGKEANEIVRTAKSDDGKGAIVYEKRENFFKAKPFPSRSVSVPRRVLFVKCLEGKRFGRHWVVGE